MSESLFKSSRSIDCPAHIFFFKTKNCLNDDPFISCNDGLEKCYITSAYLQVIEPWPVGLLFFLLFFFVLFFVVFFSMGLCNLNNLGKG